MAEKREYWAFISYRHLDNRESGREWATWIAREIETYEVPPELVGTAGDRGDEIPKRIYPVFRDEDELSAEADLSSPIFEALRNTKTVVVICSPRAVGSRYVGNEISYFKSLGREDRVLAMMIEGEPHSPNERECFPEALKHPVDSDGNIDLEVNVEPVAADFRLLDGSQGWTSLKQCRANLSNEEDVVKYRERCELAKLKIIAGILGVPLGTLIERDKAYQLAAAKRKARVFTSVAVVMGVLAVLAVAAGILAMMKEKEAAAERDRAQRSEKVAVHARGTAEGLISDMLFKMQAKLYDLNRLDLLEDVSVSAEKYFDSLPEDQIDAGSERNRGVMLVSRAEIQEAGGDLLGALETRKKSLALSESLAAANPNRHLNHRDVILKLISIGDLSARLGNSEVAINSYQQATEKVFSLLEWIMDDHEALMQTIFENDGTEDTARKLELAAQDERVAEAMKIISGLFERFGNISFEKGEPDMAMMKYQISLTINKALANVDPGNITTKPNLAASYSKIGDLEQSLGNYDQATVYFEKAVALARGELRTNPVDATWQKGLVSGLLRLATNSVSRGKPKQADDYAREALLYARSLANGNPGNLDRQDDLSVALINSGAVAEAMGEEEAEKEYYKEALTIAEKLVAADPANPKWKQRLAACRILVDATVLDE